MSGLKMVGTEKERDALRQCLERDELGCIVGRQHARQTAQGTAPGLPIHGMMMTGAAHQGGQAAE
jgi:hypothetical protein